MALKYKNEVDAVVGKSYTKRLRCFLLDLCCTHLVLGTNSLAVRSTNALIAISSSQKSTPSPNLYTFTLSLYCYIVVLIVRKMNGSTIKKMFSRLGFYLTLSYCSFLAQNTNEIGLECQVMIRLMMSLLTKAVTLLECG